MEKKYFANHYGKIGISNSTPFATKEDAVRHIEEITAMLNKAMPQDKYIKNGDKWANSKFYFIVERKGDMRLYVKDEWVAISANYTSDIRTDEDMLNYLMHYYSEDIEGMKAFAEEYYGDECYRARMGVKISQFNMLKNLFGKSRVGKEYFS